MNRIIYIICFLSFFSCKIDKDSKLDNKIDLISSVVEEFSFPVPPPPPPNLNDVEISPKIIDSLKKVKMNIAIHPILFKPDLNNNIKLEKIEKPFKELFNQLQKLNSVKIDNIKSINAKSRHFVVLADTIILKQSRDWKEYDIVYNISNISFNEEFDKAVCLIGVSRSALWGHVGVYFFEKKNGHWKSIDKIIFEKS